MTEAEPDDSEVVEPVAPPCSAGAAEDPDDATEDAPEEAAESEEAEEAEEADEPEEADESEEADELAPDVAVADAPVGLRVYVLVTVTVVGTLLMITISMVGWITTAPRGGRPGVGVVSGEIV